MDNTILNGIILPDGLSLDTLKNNIILECAELEVIYSAPSFFRWAVDCWAIKELPIWERMWNAIQTEYNPLENYDRREEWEDSQTVEREAQNETTATGETSDTTQGNHFVYGFNDNSQVKQSSDTGSGTTEREDSTTASGTESTTGSGTRSGRIHGNIGVTTSQAMLEAELNLDRKINMYDIIAKDFRNRFCILMY